MSMRDEPRQTVAVFGHVGQYNLGDEAAFEAVIRAVRVRRPAVSVIGISVNPEETSVRYGIPVFPIWRDVPVGTSVSSTSSVQQINTEPPTARTQQSLAKRLVKSIPGVVALFRLGRKVIWTLSIIGKEVAFLWRTYRLLRQVDLLAVAGSQHLNDYIVGPWNFSYTVFKWTVLAKWAGAKVALVNVGAGPLHTKLGKWFIRQVVTRSDFQSYRDESSVRCIQALGVAVSSPPVPDMVFGLISEHQQSNPRPFKSGGTVGVNLIPFNSPDYWVGADHGRYKHYIRIMADFVEWLLQRGNKVVLFPTQLTLDVEVIRDLREALNPRWKEADGLAEASVKSVDDLLAVLAEVDVVVASRFHGLIFSMLLEKLVLGISYAEKTEDLMTYMGQKDFVLDITSLEINQIQQTFQAIEARQSDIRSVLKWRLLGARRVVESQFDAVLGLLGPVVTQETLLKEHI